MIIVPKIFNADTIIAAQSTRLGGLSAPPYHSLNLGFSVNDVKEQVIKNRALFFGELGIEAQQLVTCRQVHGNKVYVAHTPAIAEGYDAIVTGEPNVFPAISVADCVPVLVHDEKCNVVAAIHAGWKGTAAKITTGALQAMQQNFGTRGADCRAYIGACISYDCFEVGDEVAMHFDDSLKRFDAKKQKWLVDLKTANRQQLLSFGLPAENIEVSGYCTVNNNDLFFSHRKAGGTTGRMMVVIGIKGSGPGAFSGIR